jgi:two-component system, cell cycle sensor histidine kinase and response regulator CckA
MDEHADSQVGAEVFQHDMELLADLAAAWLDLPSEKEICEGLADRLRRAVGEDAVISVSSFDPSSLALIPQALVGLGSFAEKVTALIGKKPTDLAGDFPESVKLAIVTGRLTRIEGGVVELAGDVIGPVVCRQLAALLGLHDVFVVGLTEGSFTGGICIVTRRPKMVLRAATIEALARLAAFALDRKRMAIRAQTLAARNDAILAAVPDIIVEIDDRKRFAWANRAGIHFFGQDIVGREVSDYFEGDQDVGAGMQTLFDGNEQIVHLESWQRRQDGEKRLLSWWCRALTDDEGRVTGALSSARDVTEIRQAELALRQSEGRYRELTDSLPQPIYEADPRGRLTYANRAAHEKFGYPPGGMPDGLNVFDMIAPADHVRARAQIGRVRAGETWFEAHRYTCVRKDGSTFPVAVYSSAATSAGAVTGVRGIIVDMTEIENAEAALRESEARFRTVFEEAADCIFVADAPPVGAPIIRDVNPAALRTLGYRREELVGQSAGVLAVEPDALDQARRRYEGLAAGEPVAYCAKRRCKDGSVRDFDCVSRLLRIGSTTLALSFQRDVTERRRAEAEHQKLQAQLAQAQKMEAIGRLAGGVAHDFNNILGGIMGGLSLLEVELGDAGPLHPDIREMKALVWRGADLAKQLLGFARGGKYDVRPLNLARVVEKTCAMFGRTRKDITIQIDVVPGLLSVLMDHTQLEQVLLNLFLNAGQAMPEGGRLLLRAENAEVDRESAEAKRGARPGHFVKLIVADTGIGMDAATQARIFEPFFTTKASGKGTGLGLASVYGIVHGHAGSIAVESAPGEGTTFTLLLPATDRPTSSDKAPAATILRGKGTILVVDDEEQMLRACTRLLQTIGYDVLTAPGGKQAIEMLRQHGDEISLVMLDMTMPEMSGRQTFDKLREIAPSIKVLLCSGYSMDGQAQDVMARGCNGFIQKPFDIAALSAKLLEIL